MASKDELYDPPVNHDSGSDTELNNHHSKLSRSPSPSSPLPSGLIHNDLSQRKGGPQADNEQAAGATAAIKKCSKCKEETTEHYEGRRFQCHRKWEKHPLEIARHNTLCKACALDIKRCPRCPIHGDPYEAFGLRITPERVS